MTSWRQPRGDGAAELIFGGGLNERDDFSVSVEECTEGKNFRLDATARTLRPRLPQTLEGTAPNAGAVTGILQLIERDDTVTQVIVAGDTWYDWDGATVYSDVTPPLFTSGGRMRGTYWSLDDILVVTNLDLTSPLYKWNGSEVTRLKTTLTSGVTQSITSLTCSGSEATAITSTHGYSSGDIVTVAGAAETEYNGEYQITVSDANTYTYTMSCGVNPTASGTITGDKGPEIKAKYAVVHDHRVWLFNVTANSTETPHMVLVSAFEDAEDYDNASRGPTQDPASAVAANDAFYILAPDGRPINGAIEFYGIIVFSTVEGKLFKIVGSDSTDYTIDEFYPGSSAQGLEAMVNTGNDVNYFRRGGSVESLSSTDRFGDVSTDDLSFWVPNTAKDLCDPIAVYDEGEQNVYYFCNNINGVLVFDKAFYLSQKADQDGKRLSPWSLYTTTMDNEFQTQCAVQVRDPLSTSEEKTVFWGDDEGNIYNMNGTEGDGDGGSANVNVVRKTKVITGLDTNNELTIGRVEYRRKQRVDVNLTFNWMDEYHRESVIVPLKASFGLGGANFWGGDIYWNAGVGDLPDLSTSFFWSAGRVVDDQISSLGFSAPGKGSGFILQIEISDVNDYEISKLVL